jgi:hypothetical protein
LFNHDVYFSFCEKRKRVFLPVSFQTEDQIVLDAVRESG